MYSSDMSGINKTEYCSLREFGSAAETIAEKYLNSELSPYTRIFCKIEKKTVQPACVMILSNKSMAFHRLFSCRGLSPAFVTPVLLLVLGKKTTTVNQNHAGLKFWQS
jgi:hypothetical protein